MKHKIKLLKKKSNYNPLETFAPPLESLQINSLRTRKWSLASLANTILALNLTFLLFCLLYVAVYIFDIADYIETCEAYCIISGLDMFSCLQYILGSSFLIIAVKRARIDYYRRFGMIMTVICCVQTTKASLYFIFHEAALSPCIFEYIDYDSVIVICGVFVGSALVFMYFVRKLRITTEGL